MKKVLAVSLTTLLVLTVGILPSQAVVCENSGTYKWGIVEQAGVGNQTNQNRGVAADLGVYSSLDLSHGGEYIASLYIRPNWSTDAEQIEVGIRTYTIIPGGLQTQAFWVYNSASGSQSNLFAGVLLPGRYRFYIYNNPGVNEFRAKYKNLTTGVETQLPFSYNPPWDWGWALSGVELVNQCDDANQIYTGLSRQDKFAGWVNWGAGGVGAVTPLSDSMTAWDDVIDSGNSWHTCEIGISC